MKTISIINLKGGVAKTISTTNIGHILAAVHNKRVLIVDNDKQGNSSKMFNLHSYERKSIADIMTTRGIDLKEVILKTDYPKLDLIPANMTLLKANLEVMLDTTRPQQTRLKTALETVADEYDYCIIDNAPDINISTINALVASDEVLIPIKTDHFAFDGLKELKEEKINISTAYELSTLPEAGQQEVYKDFERKGSLSINDVKEKKIEIKQEIEKRELEATQENETKKETTRLTDPYPTVFETIKGKDLEDLAAFICRRCQKWGRFCDYAIECNETKEEARIDICIKWLKMEVEREVGKE